MLIVGFPNFTGLYCKFTIGLSQQGSSYAARHQQGGPHTYLCMDIVCQSL